MTSNRATHCDTCRCAENGDAEHLTIYAPHARFWGSCDTCRATRWGVDHYRGGELVKSAHCGCCTHPHNLPNGGHDAHCLANPANCRLIDADGRPKFASGVVYPGRRS